VDDRGSLHSRTRGSDRPSGLPGPCTGAAHVPADHHARHHCSRARERQVAPTTRLPWPFTCAGTALGGPPWPCSWRVRSSSAAAQRCPRSAWRTGVVLQGRMRGRLGVHGGAHLRCRGHVVKGQDTSWPGRHR
jgi:hypothetical protein